MQNIALVFTSPALILAIGGSVTIICVLGLVLFEIIRERRKRGQRLSQKSRHSRIMLRAGIYAIAFIFSSDMIIDAFLIYYQLPIIIAKVTMIFAAILSILSLFVSLYKASKD